MERQEWIEQLSAQMGEAFRAAGFDADLGKVTDSNRPDLCEYQCNGAMAGAKRHGKKPLEIAEAVADVLKNAGTSCFSEVTVVPPGFLNLKVSEETLAAYLRGMREDARCYAVEAKEPQTIVLDYGGPNVAKPLHVGHLRSAVIGEAIKRILRFRGDTVIGDIHMGDWGLQMGLIITELKHRRPELPYFDPAHTGPYPAEAPFTVSELEEIYPTASAKSKEDEAYYNEALENTHRLQEGDPGCRALWEHIVRISVDDLKKNYARLHVDFDLWNGESSVHDRIAPMVARMKEQGYAYESDGALVVDVAEETDKKEIPPCMILKSDGAALYATTDLATLEDRMESLHPDAVIYVVDKRQELHFVQVFRTAKKTGIVPEEVELRHIGFGTVNGKDGRALKTRAGGVMRLELLIDDIDAAMLEKIRGNADIPAAEAEETARTVALAALKYGDLSNQAAKDYSFDMDKFISFEGDTGPYILYTIVRAKAILHKFAAEGGKEPAACVLGPALSATEKKLMLTVAAFPEMMEQTWRELSPAVICAYVYRLANDFNSFYHATRILAEKDEQKKESWIALLQLVVRILEICIQLLGFEAPKRM